MISLLTLLTRIAALLVAAAALSACGGSNTDLQQYIDEVKSRPGRRIEPLPPIRPAPSFVYEPGTRRSPFVPDTPQSMAAANPDAIDGPDLNRPREFLEQFPLDSLRMVGSMEMNQTRSGLVQGTDGLVHRVVVGNHLGQNYGRVTSISEAEIELVEIIPDGLGGYIQRPASIGLSD
ncbi:MAG TPA: pilus assembly protein PilP [Gammaproteobacteria bacterium]|nr:pilus assembly protein PilP [Gammaproteobacteria bacterium]